MNTFEKFIAGAALTAGASFGAIAIGSSEASAHTIDIVQLKPNCSDGINGNPEIEVALIGFGDQIGNTLGITTTQGDDISEVITTQNENTPIDIQAAAGNITINVVWPGNTKTKQFDIAACGTPSTETTTTTVPASTTTSTEAPTTLLTTTTEGTIQPTTSTSPEATAKIIPSTTEVPSTLAPTTTAPLITAERIGTLPDTTAATVAVVTPSSRVVQSTSPEKTQNSLPKTGKNTQNETGLAATLSFLGVAALFAVRRPKSIKA